MFHCSIGRRPQEKIPRISKICRLDKVFSARVKLGQNHCAGSDVFICLYCLDKHGLEFLGVVFVKQMLDVSDKLLGE